MAERERENKVALCQCADRKRRGCWVTEPILPIGTLSQSFHRWGCIPQGFLIQIRELGSFLSPKRQAIYKTGAADMNNVVKTICSITNKRLCRTENLLAWRDFGDYLVNPLTLQKLQRGMAKKGTCVRKAPWVTEAGWVSGSQVPVQHFLSLYRASCLAGWFQRLSKHVALQQHHTIRTDVNIGTGGLLVQEGFLYCE